MKGLRACLDGCFWLYAAQGRLCWQQRMPWARYCPLLVPTAARCWYVPALRRCTFLWLIAASLLASLELGSAAQSECQLIVEGENGAIASASMQCTGDQVVAAYNSSLLGSFAGDFKGVLLKGDCGGEDGNYCLLTICSGAVKLRNSTVAGIHSEGVAAVLCAAGNSKVSVHSSRFTRNNISVVLAAEGTAGLLLHNTSVVNNSCALGAVAAAGHASLSLVGRTYIAANQGSGVVAAENSSVVVDGRSTISANSATAGGGVVVVSSTPGGETGEGASDGAEPSFLNTPTVNITGGSVVSANTAKLSGGGILILGSGQLFVDNGSTISGNVASLGGGIAATVAPCSTRSTLHSSMSGGVCGHFNVTITGGSHITNNTASASKEWLEEMNVTAGDPVDEAAAQAGGGVFAYGAVRILLANRSSISANVAGVAGGLWLMNGSSITLAGASGVHSNRASFACGGLIVSADGAVTLDGQSGVYNNVAGGFGGGGMCVWDGTASITGGSLHGNRALNGSGGGLVIGGNSTVDIRGHSSIRNNSCRGGTGGGMYVGGDKEAKFAYGKRVQSWDGSKLSVHLSSRGAIATEDTGPESEIATARVMVVDSVIANNTSYDNPGGGLSLSSSVVVVLSGSTQVQHNRAVNSSGGGAVLVQNASLRVDDGVVFGGNSVTKGFVGFTVSVFDEAHLELPARGNLTRCSRGVYLGRSVCLPGEVELHDACSCCQAHTYSFSNTECLSCPDHARCDGGSHVEPLAGFWHSSPQSTQMHRCPLWTRACAEGGQCQPGYQGNLCGACQLPEYGTVSPLKCRKCLAPHVQLGLYLLLCVVTVGFVAVTVHVTWMSNVEGSTSGAVRSTSLIKILAQFAQYMALIGSVSVPWPERIDLRNWFQAASTVFGASSGQALSLDCWIVHYMPSDLLPLAMRRQLVYFLAPIGVFVAVVLLQSLGFAVWRGTVRVLYRGSRRVRHDGFAAGCRSLLHKLPVTALVVMFYAYPTLLRAALGFFACMRIDSGPGSPYAVAPPLNHSLGYWVSDIQQPCFTGYHRGWALGLGAPAMLLLCICVPFATGLGLWLNRKRADEPGFRDHFGFLYRSYRPERMYWEAVWAGQTVVLTLVSVMAFPMGSYFAILGLLVVFLASATLQGVCRPYEAPTLHKLHITSTGCLACTTLGALALFAYEVEDPSSAQVVRMVITVLVLVLNIAFVILCTFMLVPVLAVDAKSWHQWAAKQAQGCLGFFSQQQRQRPRQEGRAQGAAV